MPRRLVSSGSPYERTVGYSRAVVVGDRIFVAGTAPVMPEGVEPPPDGYGQAKRCLEIIENALIEAAISGPMPWILSRSSSLASISGSRPAK